MRWGWFCHTQHPDVLMDMNPRDKIPNMKIVFINIFSIFSLTISELSMAQTQKSLIGFQGVPWGTSISIVKEKFPNSKYRDVCKDYVHPTNTYDSIKKNLNELNSSCQTLNIDNYLVDGIKFHLKLAFDAQNKLNLVTLTFNKEQTVGDSYVAECTSVYNRISGLLEARYGGQISVANPEDVGSNYTNYSVKGWLPLPSEVWIANLSGDKLLKRLSEISDKPASDLCMVKVNYSKKVSSEALKL